MYKRGHIVYILLCLRLFSLIYLWACLKIVCSLFLLYIIIIFYWWILCFCLFKVVSDSVTPWTEALLVLLSISWSLLKLMSIVSVMPSNHLILCHPLLLPSVFPSIRVFSNELALCLRWPKDWRFSFSISPSSEYSGLIYFRNDQFDLIAVQESSSTP